MLGWTITTFPPVRPAGSLPAAVVFAASEVFPDAIVVFPGRRRRERAGGISNIAMAHQAVGLRSEFLDRLFQASRKRRIFVTSTHRLPPLVPVNSYHCTQAGWLANTFPMVSQGQLRPQFCKC